MRFEDPVRDRGVVGELHLQCAGEQTEEGFASLQIVALHAAVYSAVPLLLLCPPFTTVAPALQFSPFSGE